MTRRRYCPGCGTKPTAESPDYRPPQRDSSGRPWHRACAEIALSLAVPLPQDDPPPVGELYRSKHHHQPEVHPRRPRIGRGRAWTGHRRSVRSARA